MDAKLSNQDVRRRIKIVKAGIDRFFSEGHLRWSKDNFCKMLGPGIGLEDDRVIFTLYGWEDAGIVRIVGEDDIYIEVLRVFP